MKLARFGISGSEKPAVIDAQGRLRDLSEHLADITAESLSDQQLERIAAIDIDPPRNHRETQFYSERTLPIHSL